MALRWETAVTASQRPDPAMGVEMSDRVERADLCIVGAGLAGVNALFAASRHLSGDQRVILVDRRGRVGGMWVDTYPYVRLHQPHRLFTAGNIGWTLDQQPSHLASKPEVLDHFQHCIRVLKKQMWVDEFYGWTVESDEELDDVVRLRCRSNRGETMLIETKRLIRASGFAVEPNEPLPISSPLVKTVSPDTCDMRGAPVADDDHPVWVIGGGKTAMDTAHALIATYPGREVNLVAGSGTFFHDRDVFFPNGVRRWWGGSITSSVAAEFADRYDGTNEEDIWDWHRATYGVSATPTTNHFLLGLLSTAERDSIAAGLNRVFMEHMVDLCDAGDSTEMAFRSGTRTPVQPGSWIVNCTGYLSGRVQPYQPYISPTGRILTIQTTSATMHLTSYSGYFMTHLLLAGKAREVPLYALDLFGLYRESRKAFPYALFALVQLNLSLLVDALPATVFRECGLDFDNWYPLPRRMLAKARFLAAHRGARERHRRTLDIVGDRFDIRCGPLVTDGSRA